jgi:hypothetical protein
VTPVRRKTCHKLTGELSRKVWLASGPSWPQTFWRRTICLPWFLRSRSPKTVEPELGRGVMIAAGEREQICPVVVAFMAEDLAAICSEISRQKKRLERLERRVLAHKDGPAKGITERMQSWATILTPLLIAFLGWYLTDRVNETLKTRELQLGNAKEMQPLILQVESAKTPDEALSAGTALSAFGNTAIPPMMQLLRSGGSNSQQGAEEGLRTIGGADPASVCVQVAAILQNRTQLYSWQNQRSALRLIGQLDCQANKTLVQSFGEMLTTEGIEGYKAYVRDDPKPDQASLDNLSCQVTYTISLLNQTRPRPKPC